MCNEGFSKIFSYEYVSEYTGGAEVGETPWRPVSDDTQKVSMAVSQFGSTKFVYKKHLLVCRRSSYPSSSYILRFLN